MPVVYVNIGSNLGDRVCFINKAIEGISEKFGYYCLSGMVESQPWGFDSHHPFLNLGIAFKSNLQPEDLLRELKDLEKNISRISHRDGNGNYQDREVDIDIMAIDEIVYKSPLLQVPHRFLVEREFFLRPLKELCPEWTDPISGIPIKQLLEKCLKED